MSGIKPGGGYTPTERDFNNPFNPRWSSQPVPMDSTGKPLAPDFVSVGDPNTGLLRGEYNLTNQLDPTSLNKIKQEAYRDPGTMSRWGQLALNEQMNQNARQNTGAVTGAMNNLAMSGGLRTGARERIQTAGAQNVLRTNQNARGAIQTQDELNRQKWLGMLPGMDLQAAQYGSGVQDKNISRALTELNVGRNMQQQQYNEGMRAWGADKTAQAAARAGGSSSGIFNDDMPIIGGCFLTTACVDAMGLPDDCWALESARSFRDNYMAATLDRAKEIREYYVYAPRIVEAVNKLPDAKKIWKRFFWNDVVPFVEAINENQLEKSHALYKKLIAKAKEIAGI